MTDYTKLVTPFQLKHGAVLKTPIVMAPMAAQASTPDGSVGASDIDLFKRRAGVAGMLITGAASVSPSGLGLDFHLSIEDDEKIAGFKKLAAAMKSQGNKAVIQLYHAGRQGLQAYRKTGEAVAPSAVEYPFLPYVPRALTDNEIRQIIKDFGAGVRRAVAAGFDGVEIHGANHFLIQQFFSTYSNQRTDFWGGSLEKRMNFPLAVVKEVVEIAKGIAPKDFILGYRFVPEEIHEETVGYTIEESLQLIDKLAEFDLDYIHSSIFTGYNAAPAGMEKSYGELVKETVGNRAATVIVSNIFDAATALDALNYGDLVAIGREALIEPQFAAKLLGGHADQIRTEITADSVADLGFNQNLKNWFLAEDSPLPPLPGQENLR